MTPQGNQVQTGYVDLSGKVQANTVCLAKVSEPQFDLATTSSIRLSRPGVFRETGEVLIRDAQEGRTQTSTSETIKVPTEEGDQLHERVKAINVALELGPTKMSVNTKEKVERTSTTGSAVTFGRDWLIYCTSICPATDEEDEWRRTFPESYTSVAHIYRPTQFAQGLGMGVCEHIGVSGKPAPVRSTFFGFRTVEVQRRAQLVLHGPSAVCGRPLSLYLRSGGGMGVAKRHDIREVPGVRTLPKRSIGLLCCRSSRTSGMSSTFLCRVC